MTLRTVQAGAVCVGPLKLHAASSRVSPEHKVGARRLPHCERRQARPALAATRCGCCCGRCGCRCRRCRCCRPRARVRCCRRRGVAAASGPWRPLWLAARGAAKHGRKHAAEGVAAGSSGVLGRRRQRHGRRPRQLLLWGVPAERVSGHTRARQ
jgi:hypothetical protein